MKMKKVFVIMAMLFAMCVGANASNENETEFKVENVEMYKFNIHHKKLEMVLNCESEQIDFVDYAISEFEKDMLFAATINEDESRNLIIKNTIKKNLNLMQMILDRKQYKKYLMLMNLTLNNRGIKVN